MGKMKERHPSVSSTLPSLPGQSALGDNDREGCGRDGRGGYGCDDDVPRSLSVIVPVICLYRACRTLGA